MGLTTLLAQLFSTFFKVKLWKVVMKCKNVFLNFRALFLLKMFIFEVQVSFQSIIQSINQSISSYPISSYSISSYPVSSYPINFFVVSTDL